MINKNEQKWKKSFEIFTGDNWGGPRFSAKNGAPPPDDASLQKRNRWLLRSWKFYVPLTLFISWDVGISIHLGKN